MKLFFKERQKPDRPAVDEGIINTNATLLNHFFQVAIAERIGCVPADAHQNHLNWESHFSISKHLVQTFLLKARTIGELSCLTANVTEPYLDRLKIPMRLNPRY